MPRHALGKALILMAAGVMLFGACAGRGPMSDSEFLGFCHMADKRRGSCDSIGLCNSYLHVVGTPQKDLQSCLDGCAEVHAKIARDNANGSCSAALKNASDWCDRYCRTLFP